MLHASDWTTIDVPEIQTLPRPVFLRSQNMAPREVFPPHTHRWNQFVYATSGTLVVTVGGAWYVITPEQAIWVPTGVLHTTGALNGATFRNLYVADGPALRPHAEVADRVRAPITRPVALDRGGQRERHRLRVRSPVHRDDVARRRLGLLRRRNGVDVRQHGRVVGVLLEHHEDVHVPLR